MRFMANGRLHSAQDSTMSGCMQQEGMLQVRPSELTGAVLTFAEVGGGG